MPPVTNCGHSARKPGWRSTSGDLAVSEQAKEIVDVDSAVAVHVRAVRAVAAEAGEQAEQIVDAAHATTGSVGSHALHPAGAVVGRGCRHGLLDGEVAVDVSVAGGLGGDRGDAAEGKDDLHHGGGGGCCGGGGWRVGSLGRCLDKHDSLDS